MQLDVNFKKAENFIRSAAIQGAELAVLPEYHLTSWVPQEPGFKEACGHWKKYLDKYCALARECEIAIVPGTIVELHTDDTHDTTGLANGEQEGERLLNVAYYISPEGEILGKYVKKNLWGNIESHHLASSSRDPHPVFDTPFGKVGMLICWDLAFPEAFREMISQGCKLFIIPTFWTHLDGSTQLGQKLNPSAETLFLDSILTARTFENTCAIIFANAGGPPEKGYLGISQVVVPYVGPVIRMGGCAEGMAVTELDMAIVDDAEDNYQVRAYLARDDWHYDYRHNSDSQA
jgi:predicted amidohydrolase